MGFLFGEVPEYESVASPQISQTYTDRVDQNANRAYAPVGEMQGRINHDVREQSNLMGAHQPDDPTSSALSQRANQYYEANVANIMRNSAPQAHEIQMGMQQNSIDQRAAVYSNTQAAATHAWQQAAFKNQAKITQERTRMALYASLFKGAGSMVGAGAAMAGGGEPPAAVPHPAQGTQSYGGISNGTSGLGMTT